MHYDAAQAGSLLLLPGLALAGSIAIGGRVTDRVQPRYVMVTGLVLFAWYACARPRGARLPRVLRAGGAGFHHRHRPGVGRRRS